MLQGARKDFRGLGTAVALLCLVILVACAPGSRSGLHAVGKRSGRGDDARAWRLGAEDAPAATVPAATAAPEREPEPGTEPEPAIEPGGGGTDSDDDAFLNRLTAAPAPAPEAEPDDGGEITMEPLELDTARKERAPAREPARGIETSRRPAKRMERRRPPEVYADLPAAPRRKGEPRPRVEPVEEPIAAEAVDEPVDDEPVMDEELVDPELLDPERRNRELDADLVDDLPRRRRSKPKSTVVEGFLDEDGFTPANEEESTYASRLREIEARNRAPRRLTRQSTRPSRSPATRARPLATKARPQPSRPARARPPARPVARARPAPARKSATRSRRPPTSEAFVDDTPARLPREKVDARGQVIDDEDPL
jgi:hypothetical protein